MKIEKSAPSAAFATAPTKKVPTLKTGIITAKPTK